MKYLEYTYKNRKTKKKVAIGTVEASKDNLIALFTECPSDCKMTVFEFSPTPAQREEFNANAAEEVRLFS